MDPNKRPDDMVRITTPELAQVFIDEQVAAIREQIGDKKVLLALSGGVDSSVVAALLIKAIGKQLICVHVNHGLMRKGESEQVVDVFQNQMDANLVYVDATDRFLDKLVDVDELVEEAIGGVHIDQVGVHLVLEHIDDLLALALAHQAVIHMHADELLADSLDEQRRDNRAVNATGKGQQNLLVADLLADCSDLLIDEHLGKFGSGDTHHVVGTLVGIHAKLLFGSMGMRYTYANAPSYDLIICRTRCVSHRCDRAFCRGGNFS